MKLTEIKIDESLLLGSAGLPRSDDRPHLTNIIDKIERESGVERGGSWGGSAEATRECGFVLEEALCAALGKRLIGERPPEVSRDGIVGSPDGFLYEKKKLIICEYKFTWKSCKKPVTDVWRYMVQGMGYCAMMRTDTVRYFVMYVNGDYDRTKFGPKFKCCDVTFTKREINENWQMILNNL